MHTLADKQVQCEVFTQLPALETQVAQIEDRMSKQLEGGGNKCW